MIGILALVGALAMLQSGQIDIAALTAKAEPAASDSAKGKKGKPPQLFPREAVAVVSVTSADEQSSQRPVRHQPRRELYQALARMDGEAAAEMLAEMDSEQVTELLLELRERDLARILEAAAPLDAGRWVADLLAAAPQLELPASLKAPAMDAAGADSMSGAEPIVPVDSGSADPASNADEDSPAAEEDEAAAQPADPADAQNNNGAAAEGSYPSRLPDTNTA
jgi:hypothetical protein